MNTSSGRLPGKLQAADRKEEQHVAISQQRSQSENSGPFFKQAVFCSAFSEDFF